VNLSPATVQALRTALTQGTPVTLTASGVSQTVTFIPIGGPMNPFEANQALQLAGTLLAQQGILNPTLDQLRVALFGGTLATASGATVVVQGVLQGSLRNTSDSALFGTSNTPTNLAPVAAPRPATTPGGTPRSSSSGGSAGGTAVAAPRRGG
jgi:hypothetical protein